MHFTQSIYVCILLIDYYIYSYLYVQSLGKEV